MPWELVEGKLQGRGWKDCKQIGKTPNAFRWLLAAAICKILYRFLSLVPFSFFYLFWPCICIALLLPSMLTQLHLWKRPAVCQFACCFAAKENMSKISTRKKRGKTKKNFFDRLQLAANFHSSLNTHAHTLTHAHTSLGRYTLCVEVAHQLSWLSAAVDVYVYVCVCVTGCACVVYVLSAVKFRRDVWKYANSFDCCRLRFSFSFWEKWNWLHSNRSALPPAVAVCIFIKAKSNIKCCTSSKDRDSIAFHIDMVMTEEMLHQ